MGQRGHSKSRGLSFFSMEEERKIIRLGTGFFVHYRIVTAVKRVESVSDKLSYLILRGRCFNIIVLNVHAKVRRKVMIEKTDFMSN